MQTKPAKGRLFLGSVLVAIVIHWLHEAAHALSAAVMGVSGTMGTNTVRYETAMSDNVTMLTTASGPGLMLVFAIIAAFSRSRWAATVIFAVFVQRAMAAGISVIAAPNDEARLSELLGLGQWSLFAFTVGLSGLLFAYRWGRDRLGWTWVLVSWLGVSLGIAVMVLSNGIVPKIVF